MITVEFLPEGNLVCVNYTTSAGDLLKIVTQIEFVAIVLLDIKEGVFDAVKK